MKDYSFIDNYLSGKLTFSNEKEMLAAWLEFIDLLGILLLMQMNMTEDWTDSRIGMKVTKENLVKALTYRADAVLQRNEGSGVLQQDSGEVKRRPGSKDENRIPGDKVRVIYDKLITAGKVFTDKKEFVSFWHYFYSDYSTDVERIAILMAAAPNLNRKYEQLYASISGDDTNIEASVGIVLDACSLLFEDSSQAADKIWDSESFFGTYFIERTKQTRESSLAKPLRLREYVFKAMLSDRNDYSSMSAFASVIPIPDSKETVLRQAEYERLTRILRSDMYGVIVLQGEEGEGKKFLLSKVTSEMGLLSVCVHLDALLAWDNDRLSDYLDELVFKYFTYGDILYLEIKEPDRLNEDRLQIVFVRLQSVVPKLIIGTDCQLPKLYIRGEMVTIKLESIARNSQQVLWQDLLGRKKLTLVPDASIAEIISKYDLKGGSIESVLNVLGHMKTEDDVHALNTQAAPHELRTQTVTHALTQKDIEDEINSHSAAKFGNYAVKITNQFRREDIHLFGQAAEEFDRILDRIRYSSIVNDTYGFRRSMPYGRGISVVMYGPPGTGKTMMASVIANELNMPLYRIDMSQIGSKYVGETEKNLSELFEAAKGSNGILFFDEADALFAKRTDVSGSNDRYANAETAYLLQQIEGYDGMSILTTNAMQNFDPAFKRRMTFIIRVERPNAEERLELWRHIFPKAVPLAADVDFQILAEKAELTGSAIKAAAVDASYAASARSGKVTMNDLIDAVDKQCLRNGISGVGDQIRFHGYMN